MTDPNIHEIFSAKLSTSDFNRLSKFIFEQSGIKMPPVKLVMLQSRLQKRLRELKMKSFTDYADFVFSDEGKKHEIIHMLDVVSTNKTDFFREPNHFDFLSDHILPEYYAQYGQSKTMKIWSAGCSSGEEPYTIAIVLSEFIEKNPGLAFSILGTDISTKILQKAVDAIYKEERATIIPLPLKKKYLLKSKDRHNPTVRVNNELRRKVRYQRLNFMDNTYNIADTFDVVFCRNVLIYFNRETQESVINKLCTKLKSGGYLFIGHSESIMNMNVPLQQIKPTIFKRI